MLLNRMAEHVETGGLMKFKYEKGQGKGLSESERGEIRAAYARAEERKALERRNRIIFWIIGLLGLLIVSGLIYYLLR